MTAFSDFAVGERGFLADASTAIVPHNAVAEGPVNIEVQLRDELGRPAASPAATVSAVVTGANAGATVSIAQVGGNGLYGVTYIAANAGVDTVAILVNGVPISGSPFEITVSAPAPSLSLAVVSSSAVLVVGDTVTITITVSNTGSRAATDARITSTIPMSRFVQLSLSVSQGSFSDSTQVWHIGTLDQQSSATLTFRGIVRIPPSP
jgi:uncharacterized repeat protein (TIGR01451 family)